MISHGYEPVHIKHIDEVLGHRAVKLGKIPFKPQMQGFDAYAISWFKIKDKLAMSRFGRLSPLWNNLRLRNMPCMMGCGSWNQMLVRMVWVKNGKRFWLSKKEMQDGWIKNLRMLFNVAT